MIPVLLIVSVIGFTLLQKMPGAFYDNFGLVFCRRNKLSKEFVAAACHWIAV